MRRLIVFIIMVLMLLAGCNKEEQLPQLPNGQADVAATAVNEFAFDLYRELALKDGNLFFSPTSVSTALAMTWAGTHGETAREMSQTLHLGASRDQVLADYSLLLNSLASSDSTFTLNVANRLWGQKNYPFESRYLAEIKSYFGGGFEACDFQSSAEREITKINQWVAERTEEKILDLMPAGSLNTNSRLVLTNAVYFYGQWKYPFPEKRTQDEVFNTAGGIQVNTPTMKLNKRLPYFADKKLAMVSLPYQGEELEFLIVLPHEPQGLDQVSKSLNTATLQSNISAMTRKEVDVWLPKLNLDQSIDMKSTLQKMGLKKVFNENEADFSHMTEKPGLFVSSVVHKSYLMVDEQGTEAAAATGITIGVTSMPAPPTMFVADHPFLFFILQKSSGAILFMGRFEQP